MGAKKAYVGLKKYVWLKFCQKSLQGHNTEHCVTARNFQHEKGRNISFRLSSTYFSALQLLLCYMLVSERSNYEICKSLLHLSTQVIFI